LTEAGSADKSIYLSTVFLAKYGKVNRNDDTLSYAVTIGIRVPDYEIDGRFWNQQHYEGSYLFRDTVEIVLDPPAAGGKWTVRSRWQSTGAQDTQSLSVDDLKNGNAPAAIALKFDDGQTPGIAGTLRFIVRAWNAHLDEVKAAQPPAQAAQPPGQPDRN
jgi:hypothetical protein